MIYFLFINLSLLISSLIHSFRLHVEARKSHIVLAFYTLFFFLAGQIIIQTFLGTINQLNIFALSVTVYALTLLTLIFHSKFFLKNFKKNFKLNIPKPKKTFTNFLLLSAILFFTLLIIVEVFNALHLPIWEYDSISYHLPIINHFLQNENLYSVPFTAYSGPVGYYPASGNLLGLWHILPFHSTKLANFQNFIPAIALLISLIYFLKKLKLSTKLATFFSLTFLSTPLLLKELGNLHVDLFFTLSFLYAIIFLYEYIKNPRGFFAICFATSLGLLLGTKYLALPFAIIPTIIFLYYFFKNFKKPILPKILKITLPAILLFILAGGYWYIRNLVIAGNPLFPAELKIAQLTLFEGYGNMTERISQWSILANLSDISLTQLIEMLVRFFYRSGYQMLLIPLAYLALIGLTIKKKIPKTPALIFLTILPVFAFIYLSAPYTYNDFDANIRYSLPLLLLGIILLAYLAQKIQNLKILIIITASLLTLATLTHSLTKPDLPHEIFSLKYITKQIDTKNPYEILRHKYPKNFHPLIKAFEYIDNNLAQKTAKHPANIAYTGFHFHSPLYGKNLDTSANYININACQNCNYYDFRNKENGILSSPDKQSWLNNLKNSQINYIILYDESGFLKFEAKWIAESPEYFEKIFSENTVEIHKFLPSNEPKN